jgi:TonB-dependent starch-binding outer membrane protein SusC
LNDVAPDGTIVFSYVGMFTQEVPINGREKIDVELKASISDLDEVVVIGYGAVKKKDLTGSVSIVDSRTIDKIKPVKIEEVLQGTMAGVNVTPQSGAPGSEINIRIRGIGTNGDPSPTVIIDGYEGDLESINPSDIETITVLKDAQAAIYGTVGANGVILVTTKKGKKNTPTKVSLNSSYGIQETTRKLPLLNATEYAILLNESYAADGRALPFPDISGLGKGTNWQDQLFSTAPMYNNDISIWGGTESIDYRLSASDLDQQGIIGGDKSEYDRSTVRLALGTNLTDWLKFRTSISYITLERTSFNDFGLASVLFNGLNVPSTIPVYGPDGEFFRAPGNLGIEVVNPLQQIANTFNSYNQDKLNGTASLEAKFAKHFTGTARIGFNTANDRYKSFTKIVDYGPAKVFNVPRSSVFQDRNNFNDYTFDAFITYENTFKETHHVTATLGTTVFKDWGNHLEGTGYDVPNNSWEYADIVLADGLIKAKSNNSWVWDQRRLSYFSRVQYDYKGKYLASAMLRRDASTKFGPENAVAYFPSATLGWIISDEDFMKNIDYIEILKFRMSYGILGSDRIDSYAYISQLDGEAMYVFNGGLISGRAIGKLPDPNIKWEQSKQFDVGFDAKLLNDKIDITVDYFRKTTKDLLIEDIPVSGIFGTSAPGGSSPTMNAGTVQNSGLEFSLGFRGRKSEDFNYRINYNFTTIFNEVLEVNNGIGYIDDGSFGVGQQPPARMQEGFPMGYFYGYETDGLFQSQAEVDAHPSQLALGADAMPGDIRFKDINGDGVINVDDKTNIGDPIPDFIMGLNISINYKNFDFSAYAFASLGNDIVRNYERVQPNVNKLAYKLERWTGPGTGNTVPRVTYAETANNVFSDYFVEDGSFLRLQRISLGYKIPMPILEKVHINELRFYVAVTNLFTLTKYKGYDPAASSGEPIGSGFDPGFYPASRIYTFGLNLNL